MEVISVPAAVSGQPKTRAGEVIFVDYKDRGGLFRNRVSFDCCAFSFVQNGQKQIYRGAGSTILRPGYGMLVSEGNSLITEHSDNAERYHSVIVFFPGSIGREFIAFRSLSQSATLMQAPFIHFETNSYVREYIQHIRALISGRQRLSPELAVYSFSVDFLLRCSFEIRRNREVFILLTLRSELLKLTFVSWLESAVENITNIQFDRVLLNLYRDGKDSEAWHSDTLPADGKHHHITSVTFGDTRIFKVRPKNQERHSTAGCSANPWKPVINGRDHAGAL